MTLSRVVAVAVAVVAVAASGDHARGALVWEPVGPVPSSVGISAVAVDPGDARVVWIGGGASVWVSDDGGSTFALVLQLSRAAATTRAFGEGTAVEADPEVPEQPDRPDDPEDPEQVDPSDIDPVTGLPVEDARPLEIEADELEVEADDEPIVDVSAAGAGRFGISRIRVIDDTVYVCTGRGLWSVDRDARRVGTGSEVRMGRRVAVNDIAVDVGGQIFVGTARGLWTLGADGVGRLVTGIDPQAAVTAIAMLDKSLVLAASDGLRIQSQYGFQRMGIGTSRAEITDLWAMSATELALTTGKEVVIVTLEPELPPLITEQWSVPGATRVTQGRDGALWTVGSTGAWQLSPEEGWRRRSDGLLDRRVLDIAPSPSGPSHLWIVGRAGANRLVPETTRIWSKRAKFHAQRAVEGFPTAEEVLEAAANSRAIKLQDAADWQEQESLAWLLPKRFIVRYTEHQFREEEFLFIPSVDRRILDEVTVGPVDEEFRIEARWDLTAAVLIALEGSSSRLRSVRTKARRALERVRETVSPLYQNWTKRRIELVTAEYDSPRSYIRELLNLQHMEADLYVYTNGAFPISDIAGNITPMPAASQ